MDWGDSRYSLIIGPISRAGSFGKIFLTASVFPEKLFMSAGKLAGEKVGF